jgi:hypothetical protein
MIHRGITFRTGKKKKIEYKSRIRDCCKENDGDCTLYRTNKKMSSFHSISL